MRALSCIITNLYRPFSPLPEDMLAYARQDTHSLLYAYDMLKNELIDAGNELNNLLTAVFHHSQAIASRVSGLSRLYYIAFSSN